jgi:hypothetical protein
MTSLPQDMWLTRSNTESELTYHMPLLATDRIAQRIKSRVRCRIRHLVGLGQLLVLTDTTEFRVTPLNSDALTPQSFAARPQSYIGAASVHPEVLHNAVIFAGAQTGRLHEMGFREDAGGYLTGDLCERSAHLFDAYSIRQLSSAQTPWSTLWVVSTSGKLLGLTYIPAQQVAAWHWHDSESGAAVIESVMGGLESEEDFVYVIVKRTVDGQTKRYVERVESLEPTDWDDSWYVDCGLRYQGAPITTVTGLDHLEGKTVAVFADGEDRGLALVASGQITLATAAASVLVGLPVVSEIRTVPAIFSAEALDSGRTKSPTRVWVRVEDSGTFEVGPTLTDMRQPHEIAAGSAYSGVFEVLLPAGWGLDGQLYLRQQAPLPLTIVSMTTEMSVGGS